MTDANAYDELLKEICVELGVCGSTVDGQALHIDMLIPHHGTLTAHEFVQCVFQAEGMDHKGASAMKFAGLLRDTFIRHMGGETANAALLR